MSDKNKSTTDTADNSERSPQVGALLRASRIRVGEDLREVSESLCIRYLYLEAIEECRYEDLPGDTYAIGFIRSYAEHLGLDGEEVVRRYRIEQASGKRLSDLSFPTPVPESGVPKGAIVLVGVVLAVIIYGGWYATTTDDSILSDLIAPVPERLQHLVEDGNQPAGSNATQSSSSASGTENLDATVQGSTGVNTETQEALQANTAEAIAEATEAARDSIEETAASVADATAETTNTIPETVAPEVEQTAVAAEEVAQTAVAAEEVAQTATDTVEDATAQTTLTARDASTALAVPSDAIASAPESAAAGATSPDRADTIVEPETVLNAQPIEVAETDVTEQQAEPVTETAQVNTSSQNDASSATAEATDVSETSQPVPVEVSAEDLNARSLQAASGNAVASSANATNPSEAISAPEETVSAPAIQTVTQTATTSSGIVIRAVDNSWVQVTDPANGEVLFTGLMGPGATFDVPSRSGLLLDTGNAGAIDIIVNGNAVPKLGGEGTVRKGVTLDGARLIAGTAVN